MRASTMGVTAIAAVAAVAVLPVGSATAAGDSQAPTVVAVSAPSSVGLTSKGATVDITVRVTDNIEIARVVVGLMDTKGMFAKPVGFAAKRVGGQTWDGVYRARITMPTKVPMGRWQVSAFAEDNKGNRSRGVTTVRDTFVLKYATRIAGLDVTPEPVRKGSPLTVRGKLQQAVVSGWAPFGNKTVAVQFRKAGTSRWTTVAKVRSGGNGVFSHEARATAAGQWRAVYKGDTTRAKATSAVDKVALAR